MLSSSGSASVLPFSTPPSPSFSSLPTPPSLATNSSPIAPAGSTSSPANPPPRISSASKPPPSPSRFPPKSPTPLSRLSATPSTTSSTPVPRLRRAIRFPLGRVFDGSRNLLHPFADRKLPFQFCQSNQFFIEHFTLRLPFPSMNPRLHYHLPKSDTASDTAIVSSFAHSRDSHETLYAPIRSS